jgi:transposase-like protein
MRMTTSNIGAKTVASAVSWNQNTVEQKEQILVAYTNEGCNMRRIQRTFDVSRNMLTSWLKKRRAKSKT